MDKMDVLRAENFNLAAKQCIVSGGLRGDEYGHQYCNLQKQYQQLIKEVDRYLRTIDQWCGPNPDPNLPIVCGARDLQEALDTVQEP